jgi:hypothetical protein
MTLRDLELRAQQRITDAFAEADEISVALIRFPHTPDGAGGFVKGSPETLAPQLFRLLPQEDGATARTNADGEAATPQYVLLGRTGVDMARFDEFVIGARRYQIVYIDDRQYEVKGEVIYLGN